MVDKTAKRPMKLNEYVKAAKSANEYLAASQCHTSK